MPLNPDNIDFIDEKINEMKEKYPNLEIVEETDKETEILHYAKVFLYEKKYWNFDAKFYVQLMPATFLGANIFRGDKFQYSISTASGEWHKKLKYLERIVGEISDKGVGAVKHKFDEVRLGMDEKEF